VPGPGGETGFQQYCGAEYERVYALALEMIRANTAISGDSAEALSRKIAAAHADRLYAKLTDQSGASKARNLIDRPKVHERIAQPSVAAAYH
jgi:hypothetical protein